MIFPWFIIIHKVQIFSVFTVHKNIVFSIILFYSTIFKKIQFNSFFFFAQLSFFEIKLESNCIIFFKKRVKLKKRRIKQKNR